ncbi:8-oxoguanine DNA glycosylase OGG fold protein [Streptomyces sp. NPDC001617]
MIVLPENVQLPDRDTVLGQAIPFDLARWTSQLPDSTWWPAALGTCPHAGGWPRVDRRTVFGIGCRADTADGRRHLLVAALVWGNGTKVRSVRCSARVFRNSTCADLDARLREALDVLRERGAVAAYRAFNNDQHIPYLGPAFFTKVLYFAGHDRPGAHHRPVILDSVVSRALRATAAVDADWPDNGWTTEQYGRYVVMVHEYARVRGVLPD